MRKLILVPLLAGTAALSACATEPVPPATAAAAPAAPVAAIAASEGVCAASNPIDVNHDGWISGDEWNTFHTSAYGAWDMNHDGRISRREFETCYRAGGFYPATNYNADYWTNYWTAFDTNNDGYLSADEYWSAATWARIDRNHNGRIDADEWVWWNP